MGTWLVKYDGPCSVCGSLLVKGMPAVWDRRSRTMRCLKCPGSSLQSDAAVVERGTGGRSARAEYDRRVAKRAVAIAERWGSGYADKLVHAITSEPLSTRAWNIGAAGEERLARELGRVPGIQVLNDRRIPGSRANIDHVVIGPAGLFVVDAKNHKGMIQVRDRGGLLRADHRLMVGGRDCSTLADKLASQVDAVSACLVGLRPPPPLIAVLCFLQADWPLLGRPREFRGVRLESLTSLIRRVTTNVVLDEASVLELTAVIASGLPPR